MQGSGEVVDDHNDDEDCDCVDDHIECGDDDANGEGYTDDCDGCDVDNDGSHGNDGDGDNDGDDGC